MSHSDTEWISFLHQLQFWPPLVLSNCMWFALQSSSFLITLVSSSTIVTSSKSAKGIGVSDNQHPKIGPQVYMGPIKRCVLFVFIIFFSLTETGLQEFKLKGGKSDLSSDSKDWIQFYFTLWLSNIKCEEVSKFDKLKSLLVRFQQQISISDLLLKFLKL